MASFIRLTKASDADKKIYVNLDLVRSFVDRDKHDGTTLYFAAAEQVVVKEKPEEVLKGANELRKQR